MISFTLVDLARSLLFGSLKVYSKAQQPQSSLISERKYFLKQILSRSVTNPESARYTNPQCGAARPSSAAAGATLGAAAIPVPRSALRWALGRGCKVGSKEALG